MASKLRLSAHPARQAEMRYRKKLSTSKGADRLRPIPNAIAPCTGFRPELVGRAMRSNSRSRSRNSSRSRRRLGVEWRWRSGWTEGVAKSARSKGEWMEGKTAAMAL